MSTTSAETARQASEIAHELSPKMRGVLLTAKAHDPRLVGNGHTLRALHNRGLCTSHISCRDGSLARLTDLGQAVHDVLTRDAR